MIEFDEASHTYTLGGVVMPSVTQVLAPLSDFSKVPRHVLERARQRGTAVHRACELYLLGDLDETSLDEEIAPYYYQFRRFLRESGFRPAKSELRVWSGRYGYAGTLDLAGELGKKQVLIDLKTPIQMPRSTGPQTAAYEAAYREIEDINPRKRIHRYGLKLRPEKYDLVPFTNDDDMGVFLALLTVHRWKEKAA